MANGTLTAILYSGTYLCWFHKDLCMELMYISYTYISLEWPFIPIANIVKISLD